MTKRPLFGFALLAIALGLVNAKPVAAQPLKESPLQIGLVKHFFNDCNDTMKDIATAPFGDLMKDATGLEGKLCYKDDAFGVARRLEKGELQVGVFHGHEFAWLHAKHPQFQPLMVAVNHHRDVKAYILVSKKSSAMSLKDLRGKTIDLPLQTKEHCCVYLDKACSDNTNQGAKGFFKTITKSTSSVASIDKVAKGELDAILVDTITLEFYKAEKGPAFNAFLRILAESQSFPAPVIVYKDGALNPQTVTKLRKGLATAHETADGKDLLQLWQIDRFLPVPDNYTKSLADTLQRYPAPAVGSKAQAME